MAHDGLLTFFVFVTALAVLIQAGILYALYQTLSKLARESKSSSRRNKTATTHFAS